MKIATGIMALAAAAVTAEADAALNVPVAARVIGFAQPSPEGPLVAAIIYEPGSATSEAEAAAIEQGIGGGLAVGRATVRTRRVSAANLSALAGARVAFVTAGVRDQGQVAEAAARASILTISSDLACVQAGRCVVGVSGGPRTQITVSRAAARAANIRFGSAFLMLVKEI